MDMLDAIARHGILSDRQIAELAREKLMISPFVPKAVREHGRPSYGLGSYGYDPRLNGRFLIYRGNGPIDPAEIRLDEWEKIYVPPSEKLIVRPGDVVLGCTLERFLLPPDIIGLTFDKSSMRRAGHIGGGTFLEPTWGGHLTTEAVGTGPGFVLWPHESGVLQVLFIRAAEACQTPYSRRDGSYQFQPPWPVLPGGVSPWSWDDLSREEYDDFMRWVEAAKRQIEGA